MKQKVTLPLVVCLIFVFKDIYFPFDFPGYEFLVTKSGFIYYVYVFSLYRRRRPLLVMYENCRTHKQIMFQDIGDSNLMNNTHWVKTDL